MTLALTPADLARELSIAELAPEYVWDAEGVEAIVTKKKKSASKV